MDKHLLMISDTLRAIGEIYKPGMVVMITKDRPMSWSNIVGIERKINATALSGGAQKLNSELKSYLNAWKSLLCSNLFSQQGNLFSRKG